jgi:hypothetical protein
MEIASTSIQETNLNSFIIQNMDAATNGGSNISDSNGESSYIDVTHNLKSTTFIYTPILNHSSKLWFYK